MTNTNFLQLKKVFINYTKKFYSKNSEIQQNIILKEEHTLRVLNNAEIICDFLDCSNNLKFLAKVAALFHDIGRFEQFSRYNTFDDSISENHAKLSVKILEEQNILSELSKEESKLILDSIIVHNMFKVPKYYSKDTLLLSKILRDADKLDILKVVTDYYEVMDKDKNPAIEHNLPDTKQYSKFIVQDILNNKNSQNKYAKTCNDMRLMKLTWIFDINFPITLKLISERKYIEKTMKVLPKNEDMEKIYEHLIMYIKECKCRSANKI
jgi:putative nucleotidyltransferase with HDIG domain